MPSPFSFWPGVLRERGLARKEATMTLMNLLAVFEEATPQEVIEGMAWYDEAHELACDLARRYGVSLDVAAGVLAALSPRSRWERNAVDARNVVEAYVRGRDPMAVPCSTFHRNKERAIEILMAGTRHGILSGNKVNAFADNIEDPDTDAVTVDSHAYNAWVGERAISNGTGPRVTPKRFRECAADYRKVAELYHIQPHQAQAIIWLTWKRMHNL
jgi:hypothetical protein